MRNQKQNGKRRKSFGQTTSMHLLFFHIFSYDYARYQKLGQHQKKSEVFFSVNKN